VSPKQLVTLIDGRRAGLLSQDAHGRMAFDYHGDYLADRSTTLLSLSLRIDQRTFSRTEITPVVTGLLPDNEDVVERWARLFGVRSGNPFALLAHVGADVAGAVQFVPEDRLDELATGGLDPLSTTDIAQMLAELRSDPYTWQQQAGDRAGHFSLAGAQVKFALHHSPDGWARPYGRIPTTHIVKPPITGISDHDLNEHLCLQVASLLGLPAAASEIVEFGDERAIVVERFDRTRTPDGEVVRIHQEDMCQALGVPPMMKYQRDGGPGPAAIADLLREHSSSPEADVERFARALVFNWVIGGTDAHAKNYGMLLRGRQARLAPLYDLATATVLPEWNPHQWELAMRVDKKGKFKYITRGDWERMARRLGVPFDLVRDTTTEYAARIGDAIQTAAQSHVLAINPAFVDRMTDAVTTHATDAAHRLT